MKRSIKIIFPKIRTQKNRKVSIWTYSFFQLNLVLPETPQNFEAGIFTISFNVSYCDQGGICTTPTSRLFFFCFFSILLCYPLFFLLLLLVSFLDLFLISFSLISFFLLILSFSLSFIFKIELNFSFHFRFDSILNGNDYTSTTQRSTMLLWKSPAQRFINILFYAIPLSLGKKKQKKVVKKKTSKKELFVLKQQRSLWSLSCLFIL